MKIVQLAEETYAKLASLLQKAYATSLKVKKRHIREKKKVDLQLMLKNTKIFVFILAA